MAGVTLCPLSCEIAQGGETEAHPHERKYDE
jgi:hypothetical protein